MHKCLAQVWFGAELKETMWCGVFNILWTKPLSELLTYRTAVQSPVCAALNYQVKDITELRRSFAFILYLTPEARHICPLDCPPFLLGLAGIIGHREAFMLRKTNLFFYFYSSPLGKNCIQARAPPVYATVENELICTRMTTYMSFIWENVFFKIQKRFCTYQ